MFDTPANVHAIYARTKHKQIPGSIEAKKLLILSRSVIAAAMREKAIIWHKENSTSRIPTLSPSRLVSGGDAKDATKTTTSATLTSTVARNWEADAKRSEGYGWAGNTTRLPVSGGDKLLVIHNCLGILYGVLEQGYNVHGVLPNLSG